MPILGIKKKNWQGSHHVLSSIVGIVSQYILGAFGAGPHIIHSTWAVEYHELKEFEDLSSFGHQSMGRKTSLKQAQHLARTHRADSNWPDAGFWQGENHLCQGTNSDESWPDTRIWLRLWWMSLGWYCQSLHFWKWEHWIVQWMDAYYAGSCFQLQKI